MGRHLALLKGMGPAYHGFGALRWGALCCFFTAVLAYFLLPAAPLPRSIASWENNGISLVCLSSQEWPSSPGDEPVDCLTGQEEEDESLDSIAAPVVRPVFSVFCQPVFCPGCHLKIARETFPVPGPRAPPVS